MRHFILLILLFLFVSGTVAYGQAAPASAEDYFNRSNTRYDKGDVDGAIVDYSKAIELNPKYANAYALRGLIKLQQGKDTEAQPDIDTAIQLDSRLKSEVKERIAKIKQARKPQK